ncbi:MAG TPA: hypothetical protein VF161_08265 [Steroidobacteraceae bacterium]
MDISGNAILITGSGSGIAPGSAKARYAASGDAAITGETESILGLRRSKPFEVRRYFIRRA